MARLDDPYISSILTDPNNFREKMHYLSKEDAEHLARQTELTSFQQQFMNWHERLNHLSYIYMFQLVKFGIIPKKFLSFQDSK